MFASEAMQLPTFNYLRNILLTRPRLGLVEGQRTFVGGFIPQHSKCHLTAMQVAIETGFPPVLGILFLDYHGKLSPWAHVVNRGPAGDLIDFSPPVSDPKLGFIETGWHELHQWRLVVTDYSAFPVLNQPRFGDPLADQLTDEFLLVLRANRLSLQPPPNFGPAHPP